jgi:excisionase family DNA binding protein
MQKLLTAAEVAQALGVKTQTVREWLHAGKIPGTILPGGDMRFKESSVEMWMESRTIRKKKQKIA